MVDNTDKTMEEDMGEMGPNTRQTVEMKLDVGLLKQKTESIEKELDEKVDDIKDQLDIVNKNIDDHHDKLDKINETVRDKHNEVLMQFYNIKKDLNDHINDEKASIKQIMKWKWVFVIALLFIAMQDSDSHLAIFLRDVLRFGEYFH
jgi:chaperonin cofactor prefoldin